MACKRSRRSSNLEVAVLDSIRMNLATVVISDTRHNCTQVVAPLSNLIPLSTSSRSTTNTRSLTKRTSTVVMAGTHSSLNTKEEAMVTRECSNSRCPPPKHLNLIEGTLREIRNIFTQTTTLITVAATINTATMRTIETSRHTTRTHARKFI